MNISFSTSLALPLLLANIITTLKVKAKTSVQAPQSKYHSSVIKVIFSNIKLPSPWTISSLPSQQHKHAEHPTAKDAVIHTAQAELGHVLLQTRWIALLYAEWNPSGNFSGG